jgi:hypothetical protein
MQEACVSAYRFDSAFGRVEISDLHFRFCGPPEWPGVAALIERINANRVVRSRASEPTSFGGIADVSERAWVEKHEFPGKLESDAQTVGMAMSGAAVSKTAAIHLQKQAAGL